MDGWSSPGYNKSIPVHVHQVVEVDGNLKGLSDEDLKEQRVSLVEYGETCLVNSMVFNMRLGTSIFR